MNTFKTIVQFFYKYFFCVFAYPVETEFYSFYPLISLYSHTSSYFALNYQRLDRILERAMSQSNPDVMNMMRHICRAMSETLFTHFYPGPLKGARTPRLTPLWYT